MQTIIILKNKLNDNKLARFGADIDPKLKGDARKVEISKRLLTDFIEWEEEKDEAR